MFLVRNNTIGVIKQLQRVLNTTPKRWNGTTHRAAVLTEYGKPLSIKQEPNQSVPKNSVKIGVHFCALNQLDVRLMDGHVLLESKARLPQVPGCEFSGEVIEVGAELNDPTIRKGTKVVGITDHRNPCGGLSEEAVLSSESVHLSGNIPLKAASALVYGHATALLAFNKYCEIKENDIVIVIAGPAGNGLAAIEIAHSVYKAKVYAICDTEDRSDLIREKGAHKAICAKGNLSKIYKFLEESLGGQKAKILYDAHGHGIMYLAADFVDPVDGKFISVDPFYNKDTFDLTKPDFQKPKKSKTEESFDFPMKIIHVDKYKEAIEDPVFYRQIVRDTFELYEEEMIAGHISKVFALHEINEAVEYIKQKKCTGKVLIDVKKQPVEKVESDDTDKKEIKKKEKDD